MSALKQFEDILDQIREKVASTAVHELADQLQILAETYLKEAREMPNKAGLSRTEQRVFDILYQHLDRIVAKSRVFEAMYFDQVDDAPEFKVVDVYLCKLRKKLERAGDDFWLESVHGTGVVLRRGKCPYNFTMSNGAKLWREWSEDPMAKAHRIANAANRKSSLRLIKSDPQQAQGKAA